MVYVETQESWEIIIKHAEGNNYLSAQIFFETQNDYESIA